MVQYVDSIVLLCVNSVRPRVGADKTALVIMDDFKGQTTDDTTNRLKEKNILVSNLLPMTTDRLQPMDISINKPANECLRKMF